MAGGREYDQSRFENLVLYIAQRLGPEAALGRVKLAKLLMHSDFTAFQRLGVSITGATYEKWEHGHLPRELIMAEKDLTTDGAIQIEPVSYYGMTLKRVTAHQEPDMGDFSEDELAIIEGAIRTYGHESARYLSELAHLEPGWELAEYKETIPYETALIGTTRPPESVFEAFRVLHNLN